MVESGRHTSLRTRRPLHGSSSLPRPTSSTPVAESVDAARSKRVSTCRFDSCREYHTPDRTVTVAASKTAIRGSIPRGCARWEMPKRSRRRSAKLLLPGSSPGSHSIGGCEATATLSGPENQRSGKDPDGGSTPTPSATTLKFLDFLRSLHLPCNCVMIQAIHFGRMSQGTKPACVDTLNPREGP